MMNIITQMFLIFLSLLVFALKGVTTLDEIVRVTVGDQDLEVG